MNKYALAYTPCDLCGGINGRHGFTYPDKTMSESVPCPKMTKAEALASVFTYHKAWLKIRQQNEVLYEEMREARKRFQIVCHENNKLRKKVEKCKNKP